MTVAETETLPLTALAGLRLLPAPLAEPPYDDELPEAGLRLVATGGTAVAPQALLAGPTTAPAVLPGTTEPPALRLVPSPASPGGLSGAVPGQDDDGPTRTPLADLPPARPFAQALVQRLLEVAAGLRPVGQLQRDTTLELYDRLTAELSGRPRSAGPRPTRRDVVSVHVQARPEGVAEICATVRRAGRATALALRLEGRSGAWRCTELAGL